MDSLMEKIKELEKEEIMKALKECNWIKAKAARKLGITERMVGYKIKKYEIRKEEKKTTTVSNNKSVAADFGLRISEMEGKR